MSVTRLPNGRYRVRWREPGRPNPRTKTFDRRRDADLYHAEVRRRRQLGTLHTLSTSRTLDEFVTDSWAPDHAANLASSTRASYASLYGAHIAPAFGTTPLRSITAPMVASWRTQLQRQDAGMKALREAKTLLGGILAYAIELGEIEHNAARAIRAIRRPKGEPVRAWSPAEVEKLRAAILEPEPKTIGASKPGQRKRRAYVAPPLDPLSCARDAVLVSVLAYAGLRPAEALALRWADVRDGTLLVARACDLHAGAIKTTKTGHHRTVRLLAPLATDLAEWKLRSGRPDDDAEVFPTVDGEAWRKADLDNWRDRRWRPALTTTGLPSARVYDLRHSFASLLLAEGRTIHYVAAQLGHGAEQTLRTYGHVIAEYEDRVGIDAEAEIKAARAPAGTNRVTRVSRAAG